jgi:hypothetical protein
VGVTPSPPTLAVATVAAPLDPHRRAHATPVVGTGVTLTPG